MCQNKFFIIDINIKENANKVVIRLISTHILCMDLGRFLNLTIIKKDHKFNSVKQKQIKTPIDRLL